MSGPSSIAEVNLTFLDYHRNYSLPFGKLQHPRHCRPVFEHVVVFEWDTVSGIVLTGL